VKAAAGGILLALVATATPLQAQTAEGRPLRRPEITVGGGWLGGASLGSADASLRANDQAVTPFRIFSTGSDFGAAPALFVQAGLGLTLRLAVEGGLTWSRPEIRTTVGDDIEGAASLTVAEQVSQYFIDATLIVMLDELRIGGRTVPFAAAGGGYLRQLHEGGSAVDQGQVYHVGGGVKYWLRTRGAGRIRATGLRGDVRAYFTRGGVSYGEGPGPQAAVSGSFFLNF
jgi:hypothetical protein